MKTFVIHGEAINDLEDFYQIIDRLLTKDLTWKTGHNLNALDDLLTVGFGVHENGEPIKIKWQNYQMSKERLGDEATLAILEHILNGNQTGHRCYLKLY